MTPGTSEKIGVASTLASAESGLGSRTDRLPPVLAEAGGNLVTSVGYRIGKAH